jgi:uncharacterized damage-inducible protein DinB
VQNSKGKMNKEAISSINDQICKEVVEEFRRRMLKESVPRLKKCLNVLTEEEIWHRPNAQTVSVGNLVLHLCGNVRQWILSGIGNQPDRRQRQKEFDEKGPILKEKLINNLDDLMMDVDRVLDGVDAAMLVEKRKVQGMDETGLGILIHVVEHFSYHVGQITYYVKTHKNMDLKYYGGMDLNKAT